MEKNQYTKPVEYAAHEFVVSGGVVFNAITPLVASLNDTLVIGISQKARGRKLGRFLAIALSTRNEEAHKRKRMVILPNKEIE